MGMKLFSHIERGGKRGMKDNICIMRSFMVSALHNECYLGGQRKKNKMSWERGEVHTGLW